MELNAVVGVGLIGGPKRKFFNKFRSRERNSLDVFGGVKVNSSKHIGGVSPNSCDNIAYQRI